MTTDAPPDLLTTLIHAYRAHQEHAKRPSKTFRKWDGQTPYITHPIWCAMTIMSEQNLTIEQRLRGAHALLQHDVLEDTELDLLSTTPPDVRRLVEEMTFEGGSAEEMMRVWERSPECRLLKLYDKTSNLMDDQRMDAEKKLRHRLYVYQLIEDVTKNYGELNITRIARTFCV